MDHQSPGHMKWEACWLLTIRLPTTYQKSADKLVGSIRTKRELNRQIDSALYERSKVGTPKLSPLVREIAPQAEQIFRDQYVMEFIGGKEYEHENSMKVALVKQMKRFILELGKDFLFYDEEFRLQVGNSDFRTSLSKIRKTLRNDHHWVETEEACWLLAIRLPAAFGLRLCFYRLSVL